jgi:hypothetical protein
MPEIFKHLLFVSWFDHKKPVRFVDPHEKPEVPSADPKTKERHP